MGGKGAPPPPEPIDPGKAMGEYLFGDAFTSYQGVTDPLLQQRIIGTEAQYRPQYTALELADIGTMLRGTEAGVQSNPAFAQAQQNIATLEAKLAATPKTIETESRGRPGRMGQTMTQENPEYKRLQEQLETQRAGLSELSPTMEVGETTGLFGLLEEFGERGGELQRSELRKQRADDVAALEEFAPQAVEAYRAADPYSTRLADLAQSQAERLFAEAEGPLSPERRRLAEQAARAGSVARGRGMGESAIASEILGREQFKAGLRQEARQAGSGAFGQQRAIAGDIGQTILGRPSSAVNLGGQMLGQAQQGAAGQMGPQLFDYNTGVNLALQQQANMAQYGGAVAQAQAARSAGLTGAAGSIIGGMAQGGMFCWVAREVYGIENPKWLEFRSWMLNDAPSWFRNLYVKYGEKIAKFISNKPHIKSIIRKWMNTKIK